MSCQASVGLLVLRGCDQPPIGACSSCGRALCAMHQVMGPSGMACPECSAAAGVQGDQANEAANRQQYYGTYGHQQYFTDADHSATRTGAGAGAAGLTHNDYDPLDT